MVHCHWELWMNDHRDTNEQRWNIHACWTSRQCLWDIISFPHFQGFHMLLYHEEQRQLPAGLQEMGWSLSTLGQNSISCVSAVEWRTAGASPGYCLLKNEKSEIHSQESVQSHCAFVGNCPQLCRSTSSMRQPLFDRSDTLTGRAASRLR